MKYKFTLTAEVEIEAPNIAKAFQVSKKAHCIGESTGSRKESKNDKFWSYCVRIPKQTVKYKGDE